MRKVGLIAIVFVLVYIIYDQYFCGWRYTFAPSIPFNGEYVINPYKNLQCDKVQVANFHAHASNGLLNGRGTANDIHERYDSIGVNISGVSQYQKIDTVGSNKQNYIPVYEHGFNFAKTHQLIIGAKSVLQKDYIFFQTRNNKQEILQRISADTGSVIVLNHPNWINGYSKEDMKYLHYYDHLEVLSPYANSKAFWDTALSAGKKLYVLANDDLHDIFDNNELGRFVNLVYAQSSHQSSVIQALKNGNHAVVWLPQQTGETLLNKKRKIQKIKHILHSLEVGTANLEIMFNQIIDTVQLFGQHGKLMATRHNVKTVNFQLPGNFTYLRAEAKLSDGTIILFNPVYRSTLPESKDRNTLAASFVVKNEDGVMSNRVAFFSLLILIGALRFRKNKYFTRRAEFKHKVLQS